MYKPKEDATVQEIIQKLETVGWQDGAKLLSSFTPHSTIGGLYLRDILQSKVEELNPTVFQNLQTHEKNELWSIIAGTLETNDPIKMLDNFKHGSEVVYKKKRLRIRFFDFDNLENNTFFYLPEVVFHGPHNPIKPDITLFINGWPVAIIEAKNKLKTNSYQTALQQIDRYERECPQLFNFVQLGIAYGDQARYLGTWPNPLNEKRKNRQHFVWREENNHQSAIEKLLQTNRILDYLKNYTFFVGGKSGQTNLFKLIARYMQYFAAEKVFHRAKQYLEGKNQKNKGLIWHWQGSGKTYAMFFAAQKFFSYAYAKEPVVFFILDRRSLVKQLFQNLAEIHFADHSKFHQVANVKNLETILKNIRQAEISGNVVHRGLYVTTLQKFTKDNQEKDQYDTEGILQLIKQYGAITKKEILILFDEAHRSLYGDQGALVNAMFPNALRFGFTGTPILQKEKNTFELFAYPKEKEFYLDRYFINQSLHDGFTLKLTYKTVKEEGFDIALSLEETKALVEKMLRQNQESLSEDELIDQTSQVQRHLTKAKTILTNKKFIEEKAKYIVKRLEQDTENFQFKAMVIATGKQACVRYKEAIDQALLKHFGQDASTIETEIVVSWGQNEKQELEIYRQNLYQRFGHQDTDKINQTIVRQFKKPNSTIKILIVTDMLLTGFDTPILKVVYLDKMLYGHRLLQAITRTNRPYPAKQKSFGLIVDFVGILRYLKETMAFYNQFEDPQVRQDFQDNLVDNLDAILDEFVDLLNQNLSRLQSLSLHGQDFSIDIKKLILAIERKDINYLQQLDDKLAGLALYLDEELENDSEQQELFDLWSKLYRLVRLYRALGAHPKKISYMKQVGAIQFILYRIRQLQHRDSITILDETFWDKLDNYITSKTKIDRIRDVQSIDITPSTIQKMQGAKLLTRLDIAHFYYQFKHQLQDKHDPIYLAIYERIKQLHTQWVYEKISLDEFVQKLKTAKQEADEYQHTIKNKPLAERIILGLNKSITTQFFQQKVQLQFSHLKNTIQQIEQTSSQFVNTYEKKKLAEAMLTDIFVEVSHLLKPDIETQLDQEIQKIIDLFIVPIIERHKKTK